MTDVPLLIEFAADTSLFRERDLASTSRLPERPAGTFVVFPGGLHVSLPTDQIVLRTTRMAARAWASADELRGDEEGA